MCSSPRLRIQARRNRITEQTPDEEGMQLFDELALEFGKYAEDLRSGKL